MIDALIIAGISIGTFLLGVVTKLIHNKIHSSKCKTEIDINVEDNDE